MAATGRGSGGRLGLVAGGELEEQRWLLDAECAEGRLLVGGELGSLVAGAGVAGERAEMHPLQFVAEAAPGVGGLVLGDPDR